MPIIHILQKDEVSGSYESIVVDTASIAEISFKYPLPNRIAPTGDIKNDDKAEEVQESEMEILYINGERRNVSTAVPTVLRLSDEADLIVETTSVSKFEKAYLGIMSEAFAESNNGLDNKQVY